MDAAKTGGSCGAAAVRTYRQFVKSQQRTTALRYHLRPCSPAGGAPAVFLPPPSLPPFCAGGGASRPPLGSTSASAATATAARASGRTAPPLDVAGGQAGTRFEVAEQPPGGDANSQ